MRVAALDLGSNTFLLLIADVKDGKITKIYKDETRVVRLGEKVGVTGEFSKDALKRAEKVFREYRDLINRNRVDKVVAAATSAARDAKNKNEFFEIARASDIPVEVISGDKEAEISFVGSTFDHPAPERCCVIDIGGGSTEFIGLKNGKPYGVSIDMGSVRGYDLFMKQEPGGPDTMNETLNWVEQKLKSADLSFLEEKKEMIAVAGTPTTMACLVEEKNYDEKFVNGFILGRASVEKWLKKFFEMSIAQREGLTGMPVGRGDVLPIGASILFASMLHLDKNEVFVSTRGVRHGLALLA